ncbi:hypothetical protein ABB37_01974 [Leptomonas pyrrhocoris]|uniref:Uncharacterized protein n=1 Tax=Leptomonas pyrrhocoris TaxID=157538 RepID=A0A0M9G759_LEPPY|nr:hypothetical protein ABB37_01974 [Leptomonas pyrrhocoris]KPA83729.1 hypothetical protein ABB37_01974 [Leptomonas pyrrhocoris]|eukprot:XP_015662168.1 hypothetical protein ABB37_01974 [Leptomonas pyrrhocoris]
MWTAAVSHGARRRHGNAAAPPSSSTPQGVGSTTDANRTEISGNAAVLTTPASSSDVHGVSASQLATTTVPLVDHTADGQWQSSLLRKRVADGAQFQNVALTHAAAILRSEAARMDGQLLDDFSSLLRGNAVYIHNFICDEHDRHLYDQLKAELVASTGATMVGAGGLIDWSKHQVFDNPTDISQTFSDVVDMLAEYFDMDVYATRLNYYRDGTQWKPQHHDSHAYGGRALREDFTVGLTLGAVRSLLFVHEASQREFNFPQLNGDCFAFTRGGEPNFHARRAARAHTDRRSLQHYRMGAAADVERAQRRCTKQRSGAAQRASHQHNGGGHRRGEAARGGPAGVAARRRAEECGGHGEGGATAGEAQEEPVCSDSAWALFVTEVCRTP